MGSGSGSIRISTSRSSSSPSSAAMPKARSIITAPSDSEPRTYHKINDRLGPRVPKARKRITAPEGSDDERDRIKILLTDHSTDPSMIGLVKEVITKEIRSF